jgi:hypothetical protein
MKQTLLLLSVAAALSSCQNDQQVPEPSEDIAALREQFQGKYQLLSATSNQAVDLNGDGQPSVNLVAKVPTLVESDVEVRIGHFPLQEDYVGFIDQSWQTQYLTPVRGYPDSLVVGGFVNALTHLSFNFNAARTQLLPEQLPRVANDQYPAPVSITVVNAEELLVVTDRTVFVHSTWQPVRITVRYKRYTKIT